MFITDEEIIQNAKQFENLMENFSNWPIRDVIKLHNYIKTLAAMRGLEVDL